MLPVPWRHRPVVLLSWYSQVAPASCPAVITPELVMVSVAEPKGKLALVLRVSTMEAEGAATTVSIVKSARALVVVLPAKSVDLTLTLKAPLVSEVTDAASKVKDQVLPLTETAGVVLPLNVVVATVLSPFILAKITCAVVPVSKVPVS